MEGMEEATAHLKKWGCPLALEDSHAGPPLQGVSSLFYNMAQGPLVHSNTFW